MNWNYIFTLDNKSFTEEFVFDADLLTIFIDDIIEQLESGTNRNELILNVPERVEQYEVIKIGQKTIKRPL
jgi:hypothetical protein